MTGNPKDSKWYSTPRTKRVRRGIEVTLSPEALERLGKLAKKDGVSRSEVIEALVMKAPLR